MRLIFLAFALLLSIHSARSQSLEEDWRRQAAVIEAWEKTPLTVRQAAFLKGEPRGYGLYEEHASNEFKKGERVIAYAEPVGYGWKENGKGLFEFGFVVDFQIKSRDGEVLAEEENFMRIATESHRRNVEFFLVLKLSMGRAPPGAYVVVYKPHDIASDKTTSFEMPFKLVAS
jgi:hypothetical protein